MVHFVIITHGLLTKRLKRLCQMSARQTSWELQSILWKRKHTPAQFFKRMEN